MTRDVLKYTLMFVLMVLLQAVIFNHVAIFNVACAFVFIYFIIRMPMSLNPIVALTLSFFLGLSVDIFSDTAGMNSLACTLLCACRWPAFALCVQRDDEQELPDPSLRGLGWGAFFKYALALTVTYSALICVIQAFSFADYKLLLVRIGASALLTFLIILGFASITHTDSAKRL